MGACSSFYPRLLVQCVEPGRGSRKDTAKTYHGEAGVGVRGKQCSLNRWKTPGLDSGHLSLAGSD